VAAPERVTVTNSSAPVIQTVESTRHTGMRNPPIVSDGRKRCADEQAQAHPKAEG
jgi:hypothetical protein